MIRQRAISFWTSVRSNRLQIAGEGALLIILGWLALLLPLYAAVALDRLIGWLFVASGLVALVTTAGSRRASGFWWSLLSAVVAIAVGTILIKTPVISPPMLVYLLVVFFTIEGFATIMYALEHRRRLSGRWEWLLASGLLDLVLAAAALLCRPTTAAGAIGILVGINMIFGGFALATLAMYGHHHPIDGRHSRA